MKKFIIKFAYFLILFIALTLAYLSFFGHETKKFNSILENKIITNVSNTEINLNKIKIKIDIKNLSFFVTTLNPKIKYFDNQVDIKKIDAYINLKSLLTGKPKIDKINIASNEINVSEIKGIVKYQKPSNAKKFFLNQVDKGKMTFKLDLNLKNNEITNYEINGVVKNFFTRAANLNLEKSSFIYSFKKNSGEINNVRGFINGFQINNGNVLFENSNFLIIKGNLESDFNLEKTDLSNLTKKTNLKNFEKLNIRGKINNNFKIIFDKTLKVTDYQVDATGNLKLLNIEFKKPKKYLFLRDKIKDLNFEKTEFKIKYDKGKKKIISLEGLYKLNDYSVQKFDFKNLYDSHSKKISFSGGFINDFSIPIINFSSKDKIANIYTELDFIKGDILVKKFNLEEGKNKINIKELLFKKQKLVKFNNIYVKTVLDGKFNNDFKIVFGKTIKIEGSKYDASNLTNLLEQTNDSNFFKNISKDISLNITEIITNPTDIISNFSLIGNIDKGKFNKIVSKGEFYEGKYLDISLRIDEGSNKKILEIYSDLPKSILSNYKFFDGLSGGQLLISSTYDSKQSNTNLTIEKFKVKDAPGLVKLLSLADFGGMVDALSGGGLSFEKLEMTIDKNKKILNLKELYAIGPSVSILMEGYVESKTGLVSLRGTMVPAKTLNKFLSKLPILGDILIPKEIGEGLFGISFKMKGAPGKIKTTVNPIKSLTPRFIQKALEKTK